MKNVINLIASCFILIGCSESIDFSNPKSVIEQDFKLFSEGNLEMGYELVADTCKEYATLQDYVNHYSTLDSLLKHHEYKVQHINLLSIDPLFPKYRLFEIFYSLIDKSSTDTIKFISYLTTVNERGKWKVIWTKNLSEAAEKLISAQKTEDGMQVYREILKYDPLNGNAYLQMGWSQYRQGNYESAINFTKKAIELSPRNEENYNLLANIYGSTNNKELAVENYKKAIDMTLIEINKVNLLSNLSITFMDLSKYEEAKQVLNNSLSIDSSDTHTWWCMGMYSELQNNQDSAIYCYKKAVTLEPLDNYLQPQLYYSLSNIEYIKASTKDLDSGIRTNLLVDAKKQILKALDLQPDNDQYRKLLDDINRVSL